MRFSIWPSNAQPWTDILAVADHAERTGWDRVYVADHFMENGAEPDDPGQPPYHEATALMTALAGATERITVASLVLSVTYRHPAVLANWAATLAEQSHDRLVLGLGAGWQLNEHEQYGIELGPPRQRLERFDEAVTIIATLLRGDAPATLAGTHFRLDQAVMEPRAPQVPLLLAGKGDRMLGIVARRADEWNMWAMPDTIAERRRVLDDRCAAIGRDPAEIATSTQAVFLVDDGADDGVVTDPEHYAPRPVVAGGVEQFVDVVGRWAAAGVDEVIVPDNTLGSGSRRTERMDLLIDQVAAQFRP